MLLRSTAVVCLVLAAGCSGEPKQPQRPLELTDCEKGLDDKRLAELEGELGHVWGCYVAPDASVTVGIRATARSKLTVDGVVYDVPQDGRLKVPLDFDPALLNMTLDDVVDSSSLRDAERTIAVRLEPPEGAPLETTFVLSSRRWRSKQRVLEILAGAAPGKPLPIRREALGSPSIVRGTLLYADRTDFGTFLTPFGPPVNLAQLDLVALSRDGERHDAGRCGPYTGTMAVAHPFRETVALHVAVQEATTGKVIAEKTFDSHYERCPPTIGSGQNLILSRPSEKRVRAWLSKLAAARK